MSALTQGTHVYLLHENGGTPEVVKIAKVTGFNPGGTPASQIDDTTLDDLTHMQYRAGLGEPGQATISINADPAEASHVTLHQISETNPREIVTVAVGWSDGTDAPTVAAGGGLDLPTNRTFYTFDCYVADFPFDFQGNALVATQVTLQRTGGGTWSPKGA